MAKFKASFNVEHITKGKGVVVEVKDQVYGVIVQFNNREDGILDSFTEDGRFDETEPPTLRLAGRPFNIGDKVVIGGEKGKVNDNSHQNTLTPVGVFMDLAKEHVYITRDGRAWPGTPIIAEHDWEEESATIDVNDYKSGVVVNSETENHAADAIEYRERNKGVDISPGFAKDWPIDNGIEDVTVSPEEVRHIAEMQNIDEFEYRKMTDSDFLKEQHKYVNMALALTGVKLDKEAAALITETVKKVLELGGEFSLDTACEVEARVNQIYDEANI